MKTSSRTITRLMILLTLFANLLSACGDGGIPVATATVTSIPTQLPLPTFVLSPFPKTVDLARELTIDGSAVTSQQSCPQALEGMTGGIILGMDPQTCQVSENTSAHASLEIMIPPEYVNKVFTLKISWPNDEGRGLKARVSGEDAYIYLDNRNMLWSKRAIAFLDGEFYYAAKSEPIVVTFVPREARKYKISIGVSKMMSWDIGSIELLVSSIPNNIMGIAYSPYRVCQDPNTELTPLDNVILDYGIEDDVYQLAQSATAIRTYSSTGVNAIIAGNAANQGLPVYAGAWLDDNPTSRIFDADTSEMEGIFNIATNIPIKAAIIGNEYHLRHWKEAGDLNYLLSRINEFKAAHPETPVATAEIDSMVFIWSDDGSLTINPDYKPILDQIDILLIHIYPFWAGLPVEGAAAYTVDRYLAIKSLLDKEYAGTKRLIIGEAGWPSQGGPGYGDYSGQNSGSGVAGGAASQSTPVFHPEAQRQYMIELLTLAQKNQVDLFYFDAFDELWKTEGENGAGRSWGYANSDRSAKYNFSSLLLPPESLPSATQGDIFNPYTEADFTWGIGSYPIYTEWPSETKGKPESVPDYKSYSIAFMGNANAIDVFQCERNSHSGETALRITYESKQHSNPSEPNWSGAYWLYPKDNWGTNAKGQDFSASQAISFWARGDTGGEVVEFVTGGICGEYDGKKPPLCPDAIQPKVSTGPIRLTNEWQKYTLDISKVNRSNIVGAFGFSVSHIYNPDGAKFYLDDIAFTTDTPVEGENVYPAPIGSTFNIYTDYTALDNHYIPSNFMGDAVETSQFTLTPDWNVEPYSGDTSIQFQYSGGSEGWAGVYWTDPENNWGQRPGGYDLTGVTRLTFWGKSETDVQRLQILIGGMNCYQGGYFPYPDSVCDTVSDLWVALTPEWKYYSIDLSLVGLDKRDWSRLLGAFGFVTDQPGTFYLDDIVYELDK